MSNKVVETLQSKMRLRNPMFREFLAEFLGTFILVLFGDASVAQKVLTNDANGDFFSVNWGWGIAVTLGVLVSGGVSGGHINPAVTVAMAVWGKHPWVKVPVYVIAQYLGGFLASAVLYGVYLNALDAYEAERTLATAGIFATYPGAMTAANGTLVTEFLSNGNGMGDQVVGTMLLLICVCAITDPRNMEVPKALIPLFVGFTVLNIGVCFGFNCGYALNPARDLAPRFFIFWGGTFMSAAAGGLLASCLQLPGPFFMKPKNMISPLNELLQGSCICTLYIATYYHYCKYYTKVTIILISDSSTTAPAPTRISQPAPPPSAPPFSLTTKPLAIILPLSLLAQLALTPPSLPSAATIDGVAWWWVPVVAPHIGAVMGVGIYLLLVELHHPEAQEFSLPHVHPSQDTVARGVVSRPCVTLSSHHHKQPRPNSEDSTTPTY
ncbi:aquaporin-7-like [Penaeus japonicus]|uniref:aquaporin-7-like n=1 Tax=Penaeus japonicus TaxID=27405 RepID=UPI001C70CAC1|nr:aquaporin-7-like [Penaeus japonicus]